MTLSTSALMITALYAVIFWLIFYVQVPDLIRALV